MQVTSGTNDIVIATRHGDRLLRWVLALWLWSVGFPAVALAAMLTFRLLRETPADGFRLFLMIMGPFLSVLLFLGRFRW